MDAFALAAGFALPWLFGAAVVHALDREPAPGRGAWRAGCGWFVGVFLLTVWMRALSAAGIPFGIASVGGPIALATVALVAWLARGGRRPHAALASDAWRAIAGRDLGFWPRVAWLAMLAWLALRFAMLLAEVLTLPLFPWDAWTQWSTKARVWFAQRAMSPFLPSIEWLGAFSPSVYFDAAPHYPATVPLTQTWAALLIGRWDDALVNVPWWIGGVALALALYGALRRLAFGPLASLVGAWLVVSLPILEVHVALAGYADLAMASYFTLAALAALRAVDTRRWQDAALALLLLVACTTIKNPGKVWVLVLLPALLVAWRGRPAIKAVGLAFGAVALAVVVLAQTGTRVLGYQLQAATGFPWAALADAYLLFGNWNLLAYAVAAVAALAWRQLLAPAVAPYTVLVVGGLLFLFFGFAFTNAGQWVEDQSTVNRATLHLAPLLVVWVMVAFRAWRAAAGTAIAAQAPAASG